MADRWVVGWGLGAVSFGGASLLVPLYIVRLGASPMQLGLLAAVAAFVGAPGAVLFGRLASHSPHRRRLVLITLGTTAVMLAAIPLLESIAAVIVVNAAMWFVVGSVGPVVTMLVVANAEEAEWSTQIGALNTAHGYGWAGGLLLGMLWPLLGVRLFDVMTADRVLFGLLAGIAAISAVAVQVTLPKDDDGVTSFSDRQARRIATMLANSRRGVRGATFGISVNRLYWAVSDARWPRLRMSLWSPLYRYFLAAGLFFAGFAVFWAPLPHLLAGAGLSSGEIFALYLLTSLSSAVLFETTGKLGKRFDEAMLTTGALLIRGFLFPAVAVGAGLGATVFGKVFLGGLLLAIGVTWAVVAVLGMTLVTKHAPREARAAALGSYVAIAAFAGGIGSVLGGWLATYGYPVAFTISGSLVILGAGVVWTIRS